MMLNLTVALPALAAAVLALHGPSLRAQAPTLLQAGAQAPDFVSTDLAGKEIRLADFQGKVIVLDFWATWCGPCIQSLPHVQEVARTHRDEVIVLAVCTSDTRARFSDWMQKNQAKYPDIVFSCDLHDRGSDTFDQRASSRLYHVAGLPTKFVIGKDGKVAMRIVGSEEGDMRLEAGLARAGIAIDATIARTGEAQAAKAAKDEAARAADAAARPQPSFVPQLLGHKCGDALPDLVLLDSDGREFQLSSLRGRPVVVAVAPAENVPANQLQEISQRYGGYGVQVLAMMVRTSRQDYAAWVEKNQGKLTFTTGVDPAGTYEPQGDAKDPEARIAHHRQSLLGRLFGIGMFPAMPFLFVIDADGKVVGSFFADARMHEGLANLLLRAGVGLEPKDMPKQVAGPEAFAIAPSPPPEEPVQQLAVGAEAPDFAAQDLAGKTVRIRDFAGKVVVLDFWATWCGPCKAALPHVQQVAARYKDQGVVVIASCTSDARASFEQFVQRHQGDYPDVVFTHDRAERKPERASRQLYGVSGIPHQFVIGRDGRIAAQVSGYSEGEVLLDAALAKAGITVDPAILQQAEVDQHKRDQRQGDRKVVPALPMVPPGGGSARTPPPGR